MNSQSVYAIAVSEGQALEIELSLTEAGFSNDEISAIIPDNDCPLTLMEPGGQPASTGGVLGAALDLIASIGELAIPGVGRLIAAGPLLATLNAVAAGAAVFGIGGALVGLGVPETAAKRYESRIAGGDILISVHAETANQVKKAKAVLESAHAEDIAVAPLSNVQPTRPS
ncbi:MAG: hypothetical protein V4689_05265 [Verrucomicrobiota bacterium]